MDNLTHSDSEPNSFTIKVILVENDHTTTVNFLKKFGGKLSVKVIDSATECLQFMKNTYPPDAVVIGRNMGGLKFLETVRSERWTRTLPVIITSEQITQGLIKEVVEKKGDDLFPKDFSKGDLVTRLEYFIKRRHYQANQYAKSSILVVKIPIWKRSIDGNVHKLGFAITISNFTHRFDSH